MDKRLALVVFFCSFFVKSYAQQEDNVWLFGRSSINILELNGFSWGNTVVDFSGSTPNIYYDSLITIEFDAMNASLCNSEGELIAYSNGMEIINSFHQGVPGSDTISYGEFWEAFNIKNSPEPGQNRPSGFTSHQGALLLPKPEADNVMVCIYFFHDIIDNETKITKLLSAEVSFASSPEGETLSKDVVVHAPASEVDEFNLPRVQACRHANGRDWWVIALSKYDSLIYTYLLDPDGLSLVNSYENPSPMPDIVTLGQMYFSPQGDKFAMGESIVNQNFEVFQKITLYDFDRCTGTFSFLDSETIESFSITGAVAFSPSGEFIYVTTYDTIYQYRYGADFVESQQVVGIWDGHYFFYPGDIQGTPTYIGAMAHGPDGKVYSVTGGSGRFLHTVEYPDEEGPDCQFEQRKLMLSTSNHLSIPNFPHFRLGPLDGSSCDTLGIDNHPIAKFRYEQDTMDYLNVRFTDISYYDPQIWEWDFGDGTTYNGKKPYFHKYEQDGAYNVCLRVRNDNSNDVDCETLFLGVTATDEEDLELDITLFPNPVEDQLLVTLHDYLPKSAYIRVYSAAGKLVKESKLHHGWNGIDLAGLASGLYVYRIADEAEVLQSGKLVKR